VFLSGATDFSPLLLSRDQHHGQSPWCIRVLQWGFQPRAILLRRSRNKVCFRAPTLLLTSSSETWRLLARMLCRCSWSCIMLCWVYKDCVDVKPSPSLLCLSLLVKNGDGSLTVCLIVSSKKRITTYLGEKSFCRIRLSFREVLHHHVRTKLKWIPRAGLSSCSYSLCLGHTFGISWKKTGMRGCFAEDQVFLTGYLSNNGCALLCVENREKVSELWAVACLCWTFGFPTSCR
jgi:hypothetical protein